MFKVIITDTFLKDYNKVLTENKLEKFVEKIKQKLENKLMYLKRPFLKIKFKVDNLTLRLVGKYVEDRFLLFPILIYKKSNKTKGNNIIWNDIEQKILKQLEKIDKDLQNGNFRVL